MLETALIVTSAALGAFVMHFGLVAYEMRRGRRVVLRGVRAWFDDVLRHVADYLRAAPHLPRTASIRAQEQASKVRSLMAPRPALYRTEDRKRAARRRAEKVYDRARRRAADTSLDTHLSALKQHRTDTALTPEEAKMLRNQKLEERF